MLQPGSGLPDKKVTLYVDAQILAQTIHIATAQQGNRRPSQTVKMDCLVYIIIGCGVSL